VAIHRVCPIAVLAAMTLALQLHAAEPATAKSRKFEFHYGATINGLSPGAKVRIWVPVASSNYEQDVKVLEAKLPGENRSTQDRGYGNKLYFCEATADDKGEIPIDVKYLVTRRELRATEAERENLRNRSLHLASNKLVPVNGTLRKKLLGEDTPSGDTTELARRLYNAVDDLMKYGKPDDKPWGRGDALWACDARVGNCTDFHAIFIGACRDMNIPAKFEIGFPIPEKKGSGEVAGYHCWAKFMNGNRWLPVDISEADKFPTMKEYYFGNLTADRVSFTTGRDLQLEPAQQSGPVNFLVYPHVEVDGKVHTKFAKRFAYKDVE
jgi:transglutaminase-like putative cysteine protease